MTTNIQSLPSVPVTATDTPEITSFTAEFVYNFFRPDELTNSSQTTTSAQNSVEFSRTVPRYVRLKWNKVSNNQQKFAVISIADNKNKIINEQDLCSSFFGRYNQQEMSFVSERRRYLSELFEQLGVSRAGLGLVDAVRDLHNATPEGVSQEFLLRYLNYAQSENTTTTATPEDLSDRLEQVKVGVSVSKKVLGTLMHDKATTDTLTHSTNQIVSSVSSLFDEQNSIKPQLNKFVGSQYDLNLLTPVRLLSAEQNQESGTVFGTLGYIIERHRILEDGSLVEKTEYVIEESDTTEFFDTRVAYNQKYLYRIKVITGVETLAFDSASKVNVLALYLLGSQTTSAVVSCVDRKPSEPPTDFFVRWDYGLDKPVLTWNFPIDTRRHIKYFQIFRRENNDKLRPVQRPFELVRMYEFNDLQNGEGTFFSRPPQGSGGVFKFLQGEDTIEADLVVNENNLRGLNVFTPTCFIDEDFNKEKYYIYAVAAVDAHGVTTGYSNQIGVKFDKRRNTIDRVDISGPGAPKPYPNLYLNRDTFVDTIKNEGYSQMTVVFNPEFYELSRQGSTTNTKLIEFGPDNKYRIQLINTDLQEDQFVDVVVTDGRSSS